MPRTARVKSSTGIYHVMARGINKQKIFCDPEDHLEYLRILVKCKERYQFELYAYCLMPNHIHLLIKETADPIETVMKSIGIRYAQWYNRKYERVGHLFQDRFKSEPVEDDRYFKTVLRYILQNPLKAGLEKQLGAYPWSSYTYCEEQDPGFIDRQTLFAFFDGREQLLSFIQTPSDDFLLDIDDTEISNKLTDVQAEAVYRNELRDHDLTDLPAEAAALRLRELKLQGLTLRQIEKISGISRSTVQRIIKRTQTV